MTKQMLLTPTLCSPGASMLLAPHEWTGYNEDKTANFTGTSRDSTGFDRFPGESPRLHPRRPCQNGRPGLRHLAIRLKPQSGVRVVVTAEVGYPSRTDPDEMRSKRIIIDGQTSELR